MCNIQDKNTRYSAYSSQTFRREQTKFAKGFPPTNVTVNKSHHPTVLSDRSFNTSISIMSRKVRTLQTNLLRYARVYGRISTYMCMCLCMHLCMYVCCVGVCVCVCVCACLWRGRIRVASSSASTAKCN